MSPPADSRLLRIDSPKQLSFPEFVPHPVFRTGDLQTLAGVMLPHRHSGRNAILRPTTQVTLRLSDGDAIVLHDECPAGWQSPEATCLLIHGLTGCHRSGYMERLSARLNRRGIRCYRMDQRNSGAAHGLAANPYHAGRSDDVLAALREIVRQCPGSPIFLMGFSLAGNMVLKLLGENPERVPREVVRAAAVNPPIDLLESVERIGAFRNRLYDRYFARRLLKQLHKSDLMAERAAFVDLNRPPKSVREFDDFYTAPVSGFRDAEDYYLRCSSKQFLSHIEVPTLIISACDDPLVPVEIFHGIEASPHVKLYLSPGGGHLGYIARPGVDPDRRWLDWRLLEWMGFPAEAADESDPSAMLSETADPSRSANSRPDPAAAESVATPRANPT